MARLPDIYQEVEWLEGDGNQIIDINYTYSNVLDAKILIDFSCVPVSGTYFTNGWSGAVFGGPNVAVSNTNHFAYTAGINDTETTVTTVSGRRYTYDLDIPNDYYKVIDTTNSSVVVDIKHLSSQSRAGSTYSGCIFGYVTTNGQRNARAMKIYSAQFWDSGVIVRNFIPCYRISDHKPGMYDMVTQSFYINQGSGEFTLGRKKNPKYLRMLSSNKVIEGPGSRFGDEYQEVAWMQNKRGQGSGVTVPAYLVTDFYPNQDSGYEVQLYYTGTADDMGSRWSGDPSYGTFGIAFGSNAVEGRFNFMYGNYGNGEVLGYSMYDMDKRYVNVFASYKNHHCKLVNLDTKEVYLDSTVSGRDFSSAYPFWIGTLNNMGSGTDYSGYPASTTRWREWKFYQGSTLVRDYFPCYRKSDHKAGMYDILNNTYIEAVGDFELGRDIGWPIMIQPILTARIIEGPGSRIGDDYQEVDFIETSPNNQCYIDTGVSLPEGFKAQSKIRITQQTGALPRLLGSHEAAAPYQRNHHSIQQVVGDIFYFEPANGGDAYFLSQEEVQVGTDYVYESDNTMSGTPVATANGMSLTLQKQGSSTGVRSSNSFYLMGINQGGTPYISNCLRLYYNKIWDKNNVLIRDFIPCYRKSDNKTGMVDMLTGTFYPALGGDEFIVGRNIGWPKLLQPLSTLAQAKTMSRLPDAYQEVEWVGVPYTDGNTSQFAINSEYIPTENTGIWMNVDHLYEGNTGTNAEMNILGCSGGSAHTFRWAICISHKDNLWSLAPAYGSWDGDYHVHDFNTLSEMSQRHTISMNYMNDNQFSVDDSSYSLITPFQNTIGTPIGIFHQIYSPETPTWYGNVASRIYNVKISEGTQIVMDFIPCYRASDNKAGLYDIIGNKFYTNTFSPNFIVGQDV